MSSIAYASQSSPETAGEAEKAISRATMIEQASEVAELAEQWSRLAWIGLDTEFVRERTFRARPGLVQVSDGKSVWLLDAVALHELGTMAPVLEFPATTKILHSAGEDLDLLKALTGTLPSPLVDTQIAAALLGHPLQCRYEHLVEEIFGAHLPGGKARNDWRKRPLAPELLEYAAADVIWLPRLADTLCERLDQAGRLEWLKEDCQRLVDPIAMDDAPPPLSRVKGAGRLDDRVLVILDALAAWREEQADRRDLPRRFVLSDELMIELAKSAASGEPEKGLKCLSHGLRKRQGDALRELIEQSKDGAFERPAWLKPMSDQQLDALRKAQQVVRDLATELEFDPAIIASKKELMRLVRGERPEWFDGWRGDLLEAPLKAASVNIPGAETGPR